MPADENAARDAAFEVWLKGGNGSRIAVMIEASGDQAFDNLLALAERAFAAGWAAALQTDCKPDRVPRRDETPR